MDRLLAVRLLLVSWLLAGCQAGDQEQVRHEISGASMGTTFAVSMVVESNADIGPMISAIDARLSKLESTMSTYDPSSSLSGFNAQNNTEWFDVTTDLCTAVAHSIKLSEFTDGAFDVTAGHLVNLWGFGPYSVIESLPTVDALSEATGHIGYSKLKADCSRPALKKTDVHMYIDLSAYAKGFAVDQVALLLRENGVANFLVELGGEVRASGLSESGKNWRIAVETPLDTMRGVQLIINAPDIAIATSGNYRNFYVRDGRRYSHIIDPRSGRPVTHSLAAVTVAATDAARADALATALMVMGPRRGKEFAQEHAIAALFLSFEGETVAESMTDEFRQLIAD